MSLFRTNAPEDYEGIRAEVSFITDLQLEIEAAMDRSGLSQGGLAKKLGVSEARVSQILADNGANLEARTIAKIAHRLGMRARVHFDEVTAGAARNTNRAICLAQWSREHASSNWEGSWARAIASNENEWSTLHSHQDRRVVGAR